jgi:hypothetical protein
MIASWASGERPLTVGHAPRRVPLAQPSRTETQEQDVIVFSSNTDSALVTLRRTAAIEPPEYVTAFAP